MAEYRLYEVTVSLLTPLHIGSGRELLHEYDYAIHQGQTWRLNEDALLDAQNVADPRLADQLARTPPARLLEPTDFRPDAPFFRYVIRGTPRSKAEGAQLREQFKDPHDRPYLSGSSLKGALRTALAWHAWGERKLRPDRAKLGRDRRFAAQGYEHELFGPDPNHDLLRALHVSDSAPVGIEQLMLVNARVLNRGGQAASPIEVEAIRPKTVFQLALKLDDALFSEWARQRGLHLRGQEWLAGLPAIIQQHTAQRLAHEADWLARIPGAQAVVGVYQRLQQVKPPPDGFLLQLGWGTGWDGKTLGSRLQADPQFMEGILRSPRDGGYGLARGRRQPGDPFPKSRRVVMRVEQQPGGAYQEQPVAPLGWALVRLQER